MPNPFRAFSHAPVFFRLASIFAIVMVVLIYGGCPRPPNTNGNSNDNSSSNTNSSTNENTNSTVNQNGGTIDNLNTSTNTNGGNDVNGNDNTSPPGTIVFEELAATGDAVPGVTGATFTDFGSPIIDSTGRVAFWAHYTGGTGHGGLYVWEDGTIRVVLDDSGAVAVPSATPGDPTSETFLCNPATLDIRTQPLTWSSDGRLLFVTAYSGTGNKLVARWSAADGSLLRVADTQSIADALNTTASATSVSFSNLGRSDDSIVFFQMHFLDISASPMLSGDAVCKATVTVVGGIGKIQITPVVPVATASPPASAKGAVPEQGSTAAFIMYDKYTTLSPGGWMLFQGAYDNGDGSHGLYLRPAADYVVRVIDNRPDGSWVGLDSGVVLGNDEDFYAAMAISTNDHIAVQTPVISGGSSADRVILWDFSLGTSGEWRELVTDGGQFVTDLLSGVSDGGAVLGLAGSLPYVVSVDASATITDALPADISGVALTWGAATGSINNFGRAVVPYTRTDTSSPGLGFWTKQELLILADQQLEIPVPGITGITADSAPETDRPGRSGILNDTDEAVFRLDLGSSSQAIYVGRAQ
jgi:hypothetical protein